MRQQCETEILDFLLLLHVKSVSPRAQNKSKLLIKICATKGENSIDILVQRVNESFTKHYRDTLKWFPSGNIIGVNSIRQVRHWRLSSINVRCTYMYYVFWTMICKIVDIMVASRLSENGHIKQLHQKEGVIQLKIYLSSTDSFTSKAINGYSNYFPQSFIEYSFFRNLSVQSRTTLKKHYVVTVKIG